MKQVNIRPVTDAEKKAWPASVAVTLEKPFVDERGSIQPLVDIPMESCVLITSKKGTVRANHFHHTDWHYCYVLDGVIEYYEKTHDTHDQPAKHVFTKGQMFFTGPMLDHAMVFAEDTSFLVWGRNSRAQEVYEADVERIPPINP
jgi:dTDP-4-dehydrorhamnose 3,5-epimerase-like enzyme